MKQRLGFTLLELLVVIAILGFLATLAIAALDDSRNKARLAGGQQFSSSLHQAVGGTQQVYWSFQNVSGANVFDDSGGNNHGTALAGAFLATEADLGFIGVDPIRGRAVTISDDGHHVEADVNDVSDQPFTISLWAHPLSASQDNNAGLFSSTDSGVTVGSFQIAIDSNGDLDCDDSYRISIRANDNSAQNGCIGVILSNDWQFIALTFDTTTDTAIAYLDGQAVNTIDFSANGFSPQFEIFKVGLNRNDTQSFFGVLDEVQVYYEALSVAQIESLYAEGLEKLKLAGE